MDCDSLLPAFVTSSNTTAQLGPGGFHLALAVPENPLPLPGASLSSLFLGCKDPWFLPSGLKASVGSRWV